MHITLRQLSIFDSVARHHSLTRAAEELYLTQPAVSMQIKQLEESAGISLFDRVGKSLQPTEAGREMQRYGREISHKVDELQQVLNDLQGLKRGKLRVAVATTVGHYATHALAGFHAIYPGITFDLDVTNYKSLVRQLKTNETDIVLMGFPPRNRYIEATAFMENPLVVIAAYDHPLRVRKAIRLRELASEQLVLREPGSGTRRAIEKFFARKRVTMQTAFYMSGNEAVKQAVEASLGIAIVSRHTIRLELEAKRLRILPVRGFPLKRQWYVVHRHDRRMSGIANAFKDFVLSGRVAF